MRRSHLAQVPDTAHLRVVRTQRTLTNAFTPYLQTAGVHPSGFEKKKKRLGPGFDRTKGAVAAAKYQLPEAQPAPHTQKKKSSEGRIVSHYRLGSTAVHLLSFHAQSSCN